MNEQEQKQYDRFHKLVGIETGNVVAKSNLAQLDIVLAFAEHYLEGLLAEHYRDWVEETQVESMATLAALTVYNDKIEEVHERLESE